MIKRYFYYFLFLFAWFLLETAALGAFARWSYVVPQLTLLVILVFAARHSLAESVWLSFAAGFMGELFSGSFFGSRLAAFILIAVLLHSVTRSLISRDMAASSSAILTTASTLFFPLGIFLSTLVFFVAGLADAPALGDFYSAKIILTIFANLVFFYPVVILHNRLFK